MHMKGNIPEELQASPPRPKPAPLSDAEVAERRKRHAQQIRAVMEREAGRTLSDEEIRQLQLDAVKRVQEREASLAKPPQPAEKAEKAEKQQEEA
jgi:hypothetical protein